MGEMSAFRRAKCIFANKIILSDTVYQKNFPYLGGGLLTPNLRSQKFSYPGGAIYLGVFIE